VFDAKQENHTVGVMMLIFLFIALIQIQVNANIINVLAASATEPSMQLDLESGTILPTDLRQSHLTVTEDFLFGQWDLL